MSASSLHKAEFEQHVGLLKTWQFHVKLAVQRHPEDGDGYLYILPY